MQALQAQHLAAHIVNLDNTSFSAANTNVDAVVYASDFIACNMKSTLEEAEAALQLVEDERQAQWEMLLEQDTSWTRTVSQNTDISCLCCTNRYGVCARQCLDFEMPMLDADGEGAENAEACMSTRLVR